jgi:hypothetical protein
VKLGDGAGMRHVAAVRAESIDGRGSDHDPIRTGTHDGADVSD